MVTRMSPVAFGVPNYLGFHIRYICGVLEERGIEYTYMTVDQWRMAYKTKLENPEGRNFIREQMKNLEGAIVLAGAVVPGKYIRGTPISLREVDALLSSIPSAIPVLCGGGRLDIGDRMGGSPLGITCSAPLKILTPLSIFFFQQALGPTLRGHLRNGRDGH